MASNQKTATASYFLNPLAQYSRTRKRQRQSNPSDVLSDDLPLQWSSSPSPPIRTGDKKQTTCQPRGNACQDLAKFGPRSRQVPMFQPILIRGEIEKVAGSFPPERHQDAYTAMHPLVRSLRSLIRARIVPCALCAFYAWGRIVGTHKLKRCSHRAEADEVQPWLEMFRHYRARGGGPGARCTHCRFPVMLCWRTVYREEMDAEYGNEEEAREREDVWYREVQCSWVKTMQRFVTACMVVGGSVKGSGVSELGATVLEMMGWEDWRGLEENGPGHIRTWLEEMDEVEGLRCPRLLRLFWLLAHGAHREKVS